MTAWHAIAHPVLTVGLAVAAAVAQAPPQPTPTTATPPASAAAAGAPGIPAAQPTPDDEAIRAIELILHGKNKEGMALARSAFQRAKKPGLELLAMGYALDANGMSYEAVEYLRKFASLPNAQNDWRLHAKMGSIYLRTRSYRLAAAELLEADRLVPASNPLVRAYILADLAAAYVKHGTELKNSEVLHKGLSIFTEFRSGRFGSDALADPRLWLMYSSLLVESAWFKIDYRDMGFYAAQTDAYKRALARAMAAPITDAAPWHMAMECMRTAKSIREAELGEILKKESKGEQVTRAEALRKPGLVVDLANLVIPMAQLEYRLRLIDALNTSLKAQEVDDFHAGLKVTTASIYSKLGDNAAAARQLQRALEIQPQYPEARQMLMQLEAAMKAGPAATTRTPTDPAAPQPGDLAQPPAYDAPKPAGG